MNLFVDLYTDDNVVITVVTAEDEKESAWVDDRDPNPVGAYEDPDGGFTIVTDLPGLTKHSAIREAEHYLGPLNIRVGG